MEAFRVAAETILKIVATNRVNSADHVRETLESLKSVLDDRRPARWAVGAQVGKLLGTIDVFPAGPARDRFVAAVVEIVRAIWPSVPRDVAAAGIAVCACCARPSGTASLRPEIGHVACDDCAASCGLRSGRATTPNRCVVLGAIRRARVAASKKTEQ